MGRPQNNYVKASLLTFLAVNKCGFTKQVLNSNYTLYAGFDYILLSHDTLYTV